MGEVSARSDSWLLRSVRRASALLTTPTLFDKRNSIVPDADTRLVGAWRTQWHRHRQIGTATRTSFSLPEVLAAVAVVGRCVLMPLVFLFTLWFSSYGTNATFFIGVDESYFAYHQFDPVMEGGCTGCVCSCRKVLMQLSAFGHDATMSKPAFEDLMVIGTEAVAVGNYSRMAPDALALADRLDANGALCFAGINEWGTPNIALAHKNPEEVLEVVTSHGLSLSPQMLRELQVAVEQKNKCVSSWTISILLRLYKYQNAKNSLDYSSISVADVNTYPAYTDCRPDIQNEGIVGAKLALDTQGQDLLAVIPNIFKLFPYQFTSSLPPISRYIPAKNTIYGVKNITQPLFKGYYGGCRVRAVNTTGVYVEDTCTLLNHWKTYGLMIQAPDDLPVCSTGGVCVHNQYNSQWEYTVEVDPTNPTRVAQVVNVFRIRYADTININISVLPAMIVAQILFMGIICFYPHQQSLRLTQVWAYRCQNGRMQPTYLAQVSYHLAYNSNKYYLGLSTGTLSKASIVNLTSCFFAFSYSLVNLVRTRSGKQVLDRHFRIPWEIVQLVMTTSMGAMLFSFQLTSLVFIGEINGEVLRRTSKLGAKYCGLNDSCYLFTVNLLFAVAAFSVVVILVTYVAAFSRSQIYRAQRRISQVRGRTAIVDIRRSNASLVEVFSSKRGVSFSAFAQEKQLTTFEQNCLGGKFTRLFHDCEDLAYVAFNGKRCTTVEALLLTGHQFYGEHVYKTNSVMLLRFSRLLPRKIIRTFNVILIRWCVDLENGTLSQLKSCPWYDASEEITKLTEAMPLA